MNVAGDAARTGALARLFVLASTCLVGCPFLVLPKQQAREECRCHGHEGRQHNPKHDDQNPRQWGLWECPEFLEHVVPFAHQITQATPLGRDVDPEQHGEETEELEEGNPHQDRWPVEQSQPDQERDRVFPFHHLSPNECVTDARIARTVHVQVRLCLIRDSHGRAARWAQHGLA